MLKAKNERSEFLAFKGLRQAPYLYYSRGKNFSRFLRKIYLIKMQKKVAINILL
jgi:hypothetical protein